LEGGKEVIEVNQNPTSRALERAEGGRRRGGDMAAAGGAGTGASPGENER
jgi:hypothetical protein